MKSASGSARPQARWRLKRTLRRKPDFRPLEDGDIRFLWAAYRKGALASLGGEFAGETLAAGEFKDAFGREVTANYDFGWTLLDPDPVGVLLAFRSHPNPGRSPFLIVGDILWFPWSSPRQRIEAAINFFNEARKEAAFVEYARAEYRKFFEMIAKHGIMRRVGTSHNVYPGEPTTIFETIQWH